MKITARYNILKLIITPNRFQMLYTFVVLWFAAGLAEAAEFNLLKDGRSDYRIVTPDNSSENSSDVVMYAAHEFQGLFEEMTGVVLPITRESAAGNRPAVLIGVSKRVEKFGLQEAAAKLGQDGVLLKTEGPDLVLLGQNGRGQVYAVYEFFERCLGARFLAPDCTVLPKRKTVRLPEINYSYAPKFVYRMTWTYDLSSPAMEGRYAPVTAQRLRLGGSVQRAPACAGGCIWTKPFVHSFDLMIPSANYYDEHPEYFAMVKGKRSKGVVYVQPCLTHPDVLKICTEKALKWCAEYPDPEVLITIGQNDGDGYCECEKCTAILMEEGSAMGALLRFANAIADEVARKYPGKQVIILPYAGATKPPAHTKPQGNVWAYFCISGCYFHGFEACDMGSKTKEWMEQWRQLVGGKIIAYYYMTDFSHFLAPNQNLNGMVKDIRYCANHGLKGMSLQGQWNGPGCELVELRTYLGAKLMWDPDLDPMTIRKEFCEGYYGVAAADVLKYLALLDAMAEDKSIHAFANWDPSKCVKQEFVEEGLKVLNAAREHADTPAVRRRVEKLLADLWYLQLEWPKQYHLDTAYAGNLVDEFRRVAVENGMTHLRESNDFDYEFINPRQTPNLQQWLDKMSARFALAADKSVVFDLCALRDQAKTENLAHWAASSVEFEGAQRESILAHPSEKGYGDATYELKLPPAKDDDKVVLKFGTVIAAASDDGVRFAVLVDGRELWNLVETEHASDAPVDNSVAPSRKAYKEHNVDLSAWAGQPVKLTFRVSAVRNTIYDWSNWVQPRIRLGK